MDALSMRGKMIHLEKVPALKNQKTEQVGVDPNDVAKAELRLIANTESIQPRDIALFMVLCAKVGPVQQGYIHHRYRLNKMLFYQWKDLEKQGLGETFYHDTFRADIRGPVPEHLEEDAERLQKQGLVKVYWVRWGKGPKDNSKTTELTPKGLEVAERICKQVAEPFLEITHKVKEEFFPLNPTTIKNKVHKEYPEYKKTYTEIDAE